MKSNGKLGKNSNTIHILHIHWYLVCTAKKALMNLAETSDLLKDISRKIYRYNNSL